MRRVALLSCVVLAAAFAQVSLFAPLEHPAIQYATAPVSKPDATGLVFEGPQGYLRSVLAVLKVPIESQLLVFSKTSLQAKIISPRNPRSIFFNDSVSVAWVPGEPFVEVAMQDPRQGVQFFTLNQKSVEKPGFYRSPSCLACHDVGIPGMLMRSVVAGPDGALRAGGDLRDTDHRTSFEQRWGGWYVTAKQAPPLHLGNKVFDADGGATALNPQFSAEAYLSPNSDIVALMVFEHQARVMNLLTAVNWQSRIAGAPVLETVNALADYLVFVGESPLPSKVEGSSDFRKMFQAQGPRDHLGRSLRDLDLQTRLMRFPCSYMIYSAAFDALPPAVKEAVYLRIWQTVAKPDRRAVVEILRDTKPGLPAYFK